MDDGDRAQDYQQRLNQEALAGRLQQPFRGESARECGDCGKPIPEARRKAVPGCMFCVYCQQLREGNNW